LAATIANVSGGSENVLGRLRVKMVTITGDANYPTGGYAITAAQLGLRGILGMVLFGGVSAAAGFTPFWNTTTGKLMIMDPTAASGPGPGSELPLNTNASTYTWTFLVFSLDS